jgi:WD40-like Beta Propeller Repeat
MERRPLRAHLFTGTHSCTLTEVAMKGQTSFLTAGRIDRDLVATVALLGGLLGCGSSPDGATNPFSPPVVPPLESVSYALLGSGKVAFERIATGYVAIYVIDATAMSSTHSFDNVVEFGSALSPDGRRLAYTAYTDATTLYDAYVSNIDGTGVQQVTHFPGQEGPPTWTPDGAKIVIVGALRDSVVIRSIRSRLWPMPAI